MVRPDYEDTATYEADIRLGWEYPSSLELIPANPPLAPETAQWLAEKATRRQRFAAGCKKYHEEFLRKATCGNSWDYRPWVTIGPHALDGVLVSLTSSYTH